MAATASITVLPIELLDPILSHVTARDAVALGRTCKRLFRFTSDSSAWRQYCIDDWKHWSPLMKEKLERLNTDHQHLYSLRQEIDKQASEQFEELLSQQQHRVARMTKLASLGPDVRDLLLRLQQGELHRVYHARAISGLICRSEAVETWAKLRQNEPVSLEEVAVSLDVFVDHIDSNAFKAELDRIAGGVTFPQSYSIRQKASHLAEYLRTEGYLGVGNSRLLSMDNAYIARTLLKHDFSNLWRPAMMYSLIAQRLGIKAVPCKVASATVVVIDIPEGRTYLDPHGSSEEISVEGINDIIRSRRIHPYHHEQSFGPEPLSEYPVNMCHWLSVCFAHGAIDTRGWMDDIYCQFWIELLLSCFNVEHFEDMIQTMLDSYHEAHPEDINLIRKFLPLVYGDSKHNISQIIQGDWARDASVRTPKRRGKSWLRRDPKYKIGHFFQHRKKRYGGRGVVIGWDHIFSGEWAQYVREDDSKSSRWQPYYRVIGEDDETRYYVAEGNIGPTTEVPCKKLMKFAGRWFNSWDEEQRCFISNIRDEYPDD